MKSFFDVILDLIDNGTDIVLRGGARTKYGATFGVVTSDAQPRVFEASPGKDEAGSYTAVMAMGTAGRGRKGA